MRFARAKNNSITFSWGGRGSFNKGPANFGRGVVGLLETKGKAGVGKMSLPHELSEAQKVAPKAYCPQSSTLGSMGKTLSQTHEPPNLSPTEPTQQTDPHINYQPPG